MSKKVQILSLALTCFLFGSYAQEDKHYSCGTTEHMNELFKENPRLKHHYESLNASIYQNKDFDENTVYIIPVVFHVFHQDGNENITDAQVQNAVDILNRDYRLKNLDTSLIVPTFKPLKADVKIEFRLATKDPWGNCTNGIEHIYSHETFNGDNASKLNQWNRANYLNIWVFNTVTVPGMSAAGYSQLPTSVDLNNFQADGINIMMEYVGNIGTGSEFKSRALTHEVGHWLNLEHTWGSTNKPGVSCGDDGVTDTPVTKGHDKCDNLSDASCPAGEIQNVQNYMEYSYCSYMFTKGQAERMRRALTDPIAGRSSLITAANAISTGVNLTSPPVCTPVAYFMSDKQFVCEGGTVKFTDRSWQAPVTSREWIFEGGSPASSTADNVTVTYSTGGYKKVVLKVTNANGTDALTKDNYIYVSPNYGDHYGPFHEEFEVDNSYFFVQNPEDNFAKFTRTPGVGYNKSIGYKLNNYKDNRGALPYTEDWYYYQRLGGSKDILITSSYDLSHTTNVKVSFKYAYANNATSSTEMKEKLNVYASKDCGATWTLKKTLTYLDLLTAGNAAYENFVPSGNDQWKEYSFDYVVAPSEKQTRFKFEFVASDYSNNFYFDNFNVSGVLGLFSNSMQSLELAVFPNPSTVDGGITVAYQGQGVPVNFILRDLQGQIVHEELIEDTNSAVQKTLKVGGKLSASCYFLEVKMGSDSMVKKIVIL